MISKKKRKNIRDDDDENEMILNEIETRDYCLLDGRLLLGENS
jgi:hypothetical protein